MQWGSITNQISGFGGDISDTLKLAETMAAFFGKLTNIHMGTLIS